jgi:hypothetical protein
VAASFNPGPPASTLRGTPRSDAIPGKLGWVGRMRWQAW